MLAVVYNDNESCLCSSAQTRHGSDGTVNHSPRVGDHSESGDDNDDDWGDDKSVHVDIDIGLVEW